MEAVHHENLSRSAFPKLHHVAVLLVSMLAGGCCCGSLWYDMEAQRTWAELESGVHAAATPIDAEQTGVSMQLPTLFAPKDVVAMRPGGQVAGIAVSDTRLYPTLVKDDKPVVIRLPNMRFAYEMQVYDDGADKPVYCYLGVLPKKGAAVKNAKEQILQAIAAIAPEANWENNKSLGDGATTADYLTVTGSQHFDAPPPTGAHVAPGRLDLYFVKKDHATVFVGFRGSSDVAKSVSLFKAGEAAVATITSEPPAKPIDAPSDELSPPAGDFVVAPNTNVKLVPPPGFAPSSRFSGFRKEATGSQIVVETRATPYTATIGAYNENYFHVNDIVQTSREEVSIAGKTALLMLLTSGGHEHWTLVFGDASQSFVVTGTVTDPEDKDALRGALLTARKK